MPTASIICDGKTADHPVVSHEEWLRARTAFLGREKEFSRLRDELARDRRALPWEAVEREYIFEGAKGSETLAQLFDGRSQLIVYHFMFDPEWDAGCPHCSHWADSFNGVTAHLAHRDVSFVAISRASFDKLAAYQERMGWSFKWLSSEGTNFNYDYFASFTPGEIAANSAFYNFSNSNPGQQDREGASAFYKDAHDCIFHTYSTYARGIDLFSTDYNYLDIAPKGRDEAGKGPFWVRRHDEYDK